MKTKHILIFNWRDTWDPKSGGAERVTLEHAKAWVKKGHQVSWVCGRYASALENEHIDGIQYYRRGNGRTLFARAWWIYRQEFQGKVDIIIDEVHGLPMFSPLWKGKTRTVVFIHEVAKEIWDEMLPFPFSWIGKWIESTVFPSLYKREQFWVDSSSTQLDLIALGIPKNQIIVIPCAIVPLVLTPPPKKEQTLTCIFVARLVKMKGIEYAIKTFKQVQESIPQATLWIVGDGETEYLKTLHALIEELELSHQVKFWGKVTEKKKYTLLAKAHFLIHTSVREGFGLTVLEANSQRTIAAVFDVPSLRDLVDDSRGIIVPFTDTSQLAEHIVRVYKDGKRRNSMQQASFSFSKQFTWSSFTRMSERVLQL